MALIIIKWWNDVVFSLLYNKFKLSGMIFLTSLSFLFSNFFPVLYKKSNHKRLFGPYSHMTNARHTRVYARHDYCLSLRCIPNIWCMYWNFSSRYSFWFSMSLNHIGKIDTEWNHFKLLYICSRHFHVHFDSKLWFKRLCLFDREQLKLHSHLFNLFKIFQWKNFNDILSI